MQNATSGSTHVSAMPGKSSEVRQQLTLLLLRDFDNLLLDALRFGRVAAIPKSVQKLTTTKHAEKNFILNSASTEKPSISVDWSIDDSWSQHKAW
jgi:hypothetical protein